MDQLQNACYKLTYNFDGKKLYVYISVVLIDIAYAAIVL